MEATLRKNGQKMVTITIKHYADCRTFVMSAVKQLYSNYDYDRNLEKKKLIKAAFEAELRQDLAFDGLEWKEQLEECLLNYWDEDDQFNYAFFVEKAIAFIKKNYSFQDSDFAPVIKLKEMAIANKEENEDDE